MAHFAKLDENNNVLEVHVIDNSAIDLTDEESSGIAFLTQWSGGYSNWKRTSYNAKENGFRKNYAGVGYKYDENKNAFIPPKTFNSWILNEETCLWEAPKPYPKDGKRYFWNEDKIEWQELSN